MSDWVIPLVCPDLGDEELAAVSRVLRSGWLSMGPEVQAFEQEFATFVRVKHAFVVANGTAALHLAYIAAGLGPGDEIIQPAVNFVAAANMTIAVGARPVFADIISLAEPTISPEDIERCITSRTRAVVVMHYGGNFCRMGEIAELCQRHKLVLIEDACHALGATYSSHAYPDLNGRAAGGLGDVACFSFFSNKNLVTGEGGMLATDSDEIASRVKLLRTHGMNTISWDRHKGHASGYDVLLNGYNYRLDEIHAALGRTQLQKLGRNNQRRKLAVQTYIEKLQRLPDWIIPFADGAADGANHLMVVVAPDQESRHWAAQRLKDAGIQTSQHYPCVADFTAFQRCQDRSLTNSRQFASRVLTLPLYAQITEPEVGEVCKAIDSKMRAPC